MKTNLLRAFSLIALFLAGSVTSLIAEETGELRPIQVDDYFALKYVGSPAVSPDGKWVAYTVSGQDLEKDSRGTRVWMIPAAGGDPLPMTAKGSSAWSPRWSPDGKHLSFIASRNGHGSQVHKLDMRGGEGIQVTNIERGVEGYEWSPDGKKLVLIIRDPDENSDQQLFEKLGINNRKAAIKMYE